MHPLHNARIKAGLTTWKLAQLAGVDENTIKEIEQEPRRRKTHFMTAILLENALGMDGQLFHPSELSDIGWSVVPDKSNGSRKVDCASFETLCPGCRLVVPNTPICGYCDCNIAEHRAFEEIVAGIAA